jgi:hypothetical protein
MSYPDLRKVADYLRLIFFLFIIILGMYAIYFEIIIIELTQGKKYASFFWSLLNGLILGMYLNITGFFHKAMKKTYKYIALFVIVAFFIQGFGYFGFRFTFNLPSDINFLSYNKIDTNSYTFIRFIHYNWYFFVFILVISFIVESDTHE